MLAEASASAFGASAASAAAAGGATARAGVPNTLPPKPDGAAPAVPKPAEALAPKVADPRTKDELGAPKTGAAPPPNAAAGGALDGWPKMDGAPLPPKAVAAAAGAVSVGCVTEAGA